MRVLLDVHALVALAWDDHVHHAAVLDWFAAHPEAAWATCPVTESSLVRLSCNRHVMEFPLTPALAVELLTELRNDPAHKFLSDDVSPSAPDFPVIHGYRQTTDAHLLTLARRHSCRLLTFDRGIAGLADGDLELLTAAVGPWALDG